jgi:HK97 family phage portal protein
MSVIDRAFSDVFKNRAASGTSVSSSGFLDFSFIPGMGVSSTGKTAFTLSAFYNGVDQISNDIAKLPKAVFYKDGENRFPLASHPVNYLMSVAPNEMMTSFDFWKIIIIAMIYKGNAYVRIIRNAVTGKQEQWIFLTPEDVTVYEQNNKLFYRHKGEVIDGSDMLHYKGFSFDGKMGVGIVRFAAKQLGIALNAQDYASVVYQDRGIGYGVIESEQDVNPANKKAIEEGFVAKMSSKSAFKVPMLDAGMKYKTINISPAEAQLLETRKDVVIEVCRWLNLSPYKLKDLTNANYSNMYQLSIEHVQDSLLPWSIRLEQETLRKAFTDKEKQTLYIKFNEKFLLRGDLEARKNYFTAMVYAGIITRNEARALEDMNPIDGLEEPLQPVNMQALSVANEIIKTQQNGNSSK